ncbi:helix-turn-helix domain-containing protein [Falsibacillus albus]|uniref:Helix-turn-helix domain-containing protein n=1 Tax=Falsibacillus albus TaxID=2478915 RepID=A0A3L7JLF9_9BACI|nr:helix-turn-helix domain-containing protein [Falsibacillus albus]RLQ91658.1 helix-turn-helix domain-containing protein [Falsibacillus albus]
MTELGNKLKEAREANGFSLDDLQTLTKIQKRYLIGIEEGNYEMMPGKFYVRAFIKQYAEAVGLQPDALFEEYKGDIPDIYSQDLPQHISRVQTHKAVSSSSSKLLDALPKLLAGVFVVAVIALAWILVQHNMSGDGSNQASDNPKQVKSDVNSDVEKQADQQTEGSKDKNNGKGQGSDKKDDSKNDQADKPVADKPEQKVSVVDSAGTNTTYKVENAAKFQLKLAATSTGKTWVSVKNGGGQLIFQGLLSNGASKDLDLTQEKAVTIRIGDTTSTEMFVNDQKVEFAIPPSERTTQNVTYQYTPGEQQPS